MIIGVIETERRRVLAGQLFLLQLFDVREIGAKDIFIPTDSLQSTLFRGRQDGFQYIVLTELRRAKILEDSVLVILRMNRGIASAVESIRVIFLLTVVG